MKTIKWNYPEKEGKCIKCHKEGLVSDAKFWWHNEYCYECVKIMIETPIIG